MKLELALAVLIASATLQACEGASAQQTQAPTTPPSNGANDALSKAVTVTRDASAATGGDLGFVNAAAYDYTKSGANETALEWVRLVVLDNHSVTSAGNTALYAQARKLSTGATFAGVSEAIDLTGLPGALVSHEFDSWVTGPDNGLRIGLEVLNGDAKHIRGLGRSNAAESTAALRIGQTVSTPWASWNTGIQIGGNITQSAIKLVSPEGQILFEVKPNGEVWSQGRRL